mgnify:CR=1 FL=1
MRALLPRVAAALRSASWIADGVLGAHGYQNYLAHQRDMNAAITALRANARKQLAGQIQKLVIARQLLR